MSQEEKYTPPAIYAAMVAIAAELAKVGIGKDRKNQAQGFNFRGIDDVMNVVGPLLSQHSVTFREEYCDFAEVDRVNPAKGTTLIYTRVKGNFTFISAIDGSESTVTTYGVAMDSGDKACNKAMSAALKYALLQTFLIPTESNEDADATTPEPSAPVAPAGYDEWLDELKGIAELGYAPLAAAFKVGKDGYREHAKLMKAMEPLKARALAVDGAAKKAAQA